MYNKLAILFLMVMSFLLLGCATSDMDTEFETQTGNYSIDDIKKDDKRKINAIFGDGEEMLAIDAEVAIPDGQLQYGTLTTKSMDISLVENYLCGGEKLHEQDLENSEDFTSEKENSENFPLGKEYVSDHNEVDNDLNYDLLFIERFDNSGSADFTNFRLDEFLSGTDFVTVEEKDWTKEQQNFVEAMNTRCQQLFENIGLESEWSGTQLATGSTNDCCTIYMDSLLNGIPLIKGGMYIQSNVRIGEPGVNVAAFRGLYAIEKAESTTILSIDEVIEIIKQGVENKSISTMKEPLTEIRLAYKVKTTNHGIEFYPVWAFGFQIDETNIIIPVLCINAQNGTVESVDED